MNVQLTATNSSKFKSHYSQLSFAGVCQGGILTSKLACSMFHPYTNQNQAGCLLQGERNKACTSLANFVGQEIQGGTDV